MKNHGRFMGGSKSSFLWLALFAAVLVLFPFEWLSDVWPAYALVFDRVFATALAHEIGHATIFLLAGLLLLRSMPRLRRYPLFYMVILVLGALGEELLQALSLNRWQPSDVIDWRAFGFDTLGFVLAYLLVWLWRRLITSPRGPGNNLSAKQQERGITRGTPLLAREQEHGLTYGTALLVKQPDRGITRRTALFGFAVAVGAIAVGGGAGIWYTSTRRSRPQLLTYTGHRGATITALTWSPDGNYIASGDANGTLLVWDTSTGATILACREPTANSVSSVSWSPDGTSILAGYTNMLVIWDAGSGKSTFTTAHLTGPAAYSPVGDYKPCYLIYPSLIAACQNQQSVLVFSSTSLNAPIASIRFWKH